MGELAGGSDPAEGADIVRRVLEGEHGARRDVVLLNAGAAFQVAGFAASFEEGMATAARAIDEGGAIAALGRWVAVSNAPSGDQ
jgi:anthranilate phosphoribosyltransferase